MRPSFEDVKTAAERLDGHVRETRLMRSDRIDAITGRAIWFKPECNQKVGAFKYRGAFNRLSAMSRDERARGVVAFSSGNHAQGVARAAKELGMSAVIVMPSDAPQVKVDGVLRDGAKIISYDRHRESREGIAARIARDEGRIVVPSYDDAYIIAGQGTVGLEVAQSDIEFDGLITNMGGGGLCAGISLALQTLSPRTQIFGAEPEHYNDHQMSLRSGEIVRLQTPPPTLCDAVMTPEPGKLTWPINRQSLRDVFTAKDETCLWAMALAKRELDVTLEPGGALSLAVLLEGELNTYSDIKTVCVVLSGGNVDPEIMERALQAYPA